MREATPAPLAGVDIVVAPTVDEATLRALLADVADGTCFSVAAVLVDEAGWRCRFLAVVPDLVLGWANTIALQSAIGRHVPVLAVERIGDRALAFVA